jgi:two-component system alkaline phosphatase synthesis response regulator PhoP
MLLETNVYLKLSDDFLIWPCDKRELILRINRLLKKAPGVKSCDQIICNDLVIDLTTCEVMVTGTKAELTYKEYELLKLMAGNKGRVFTRQTLLDRIWGFDYFGGDRTVDVHVRRLRSKIENSDRTYIETVRNIGYKFNKEA